MLPGTHVIRGCSPATGARESTAQEEKGAADAAGREAAYAGGREAAYAGGREAAYAGGRRSTVTAASQRANAAQLVDGAVSNNGTGANEGANIPSTALQSGK